MLIGFMLGLLGERHLDSLLSRWHSEVNQINIIIIRLIWSLLIQERKVEMWI